MSWSGRKISRLRQLVLDEYGARCAKCKGWIDLSLAHPHPRSLTIGHQLPRSLGGSDDLSNLRPEHRACNLKAGSRLTSTARPLDLPAWLDPPPAGPGF